jgi:hypothetical protein
MSEIRVNNITNRDGTAGPSIAGIPVVDSNSHFVVPTGRTGQRYADEGENIVRDGLVLYLDAKYSYPGATGTNPDVYTWYDMSGNENNGELKNGVSYSGTGEGSLIFDGVNDHTSLNDFSLGKQITISCWIKTSLTSFAQLVARGNGANNLGVYLSINFTTGLLSAGGNAGGGWNAQNISNSIINDNNWHYVVGVYNQSLNTVTGYVDGNIGLSRTVTFETDNYSPKYTNLARNQVPGAGGDVQYFTGNIAQVSVYNRELSAAEVLQNYNTHKSRFGL